MPWANGVAMGSRFTRRRFLTALGAGAVYLALTNTVGCELLERTSKLTSLRLPRLGPLRTPKVWPLPSVSSPPEEGVWSFLSRPDLSPAAVEVTTTQAHEDTAPVYIFVAFKEGAGEHGHGRARHRRICDLRCLLPRDRPGARGQRLPWGPPRVPHHPPRHRAAHRLRCCAHRPVPDRWSQGRRGVGRDRPGGGH